MARRHGHGVGCVHSGFTVNLLSPAFSCQEKLFFLFIGYSFFFTASSDTRKKNAKIHEIWPQFFSGEFPHFWFGWTNKKKKGLLRYLSSASSIIGVLMFVSLYLKKTFTLRDSCKCEKRTRVDLSVKSPSLTCRSTGLCSAIQIIVLIELGYHVSSHPTTIPPGLRIVTKVKTSINGKMSDVLDITITKRNSEWPNHDYRFQIEQLVFSQGKLDQQKWF